MVPFIRLGASLSFNYTHCCFLLNMLEIHCQPPCTMHHCCRQPIEVPLLVALTHVFSREPVKHCFQITFHDKTLLSVGKKHSSWIIVVIILLFIFRPHHPLRHTYIHPWHLDINVGVKCEIMRIFECFFSLSFSEPSL